MPVHTYSRLSSTTYHIYKGKCIYFRSTRVHQYFQSLALAYFLSEIKATEMEIIGHCKWAKKLKKKKNHNFFFALVQGWKLLVFEIPSDLPINKHLILVTE